MKKVLVFGLVCTLFLTGCGGKKLTCTMTQDEDGMKSEQKVVLTFDKEGKEIQKGSFNASVEVGEEYAEYMAMYEALFLAGFEDIKDIADVETKTTDTSLSVKVKYDATDFTEDEKQALEDAGVYLEGTYDEIKSGYEEDGFTCK